jgi:L-alanine-DL-glutamate epimerase-like enolase superfamily enzyme
VPSFKQGASAIAALDIVIVEVSTDAGVTGWGDAWGYVLSTIYRHRDR